MLRSLVVLSTSTVVARLWRLLVVWGLERGATAEIENNGDSIQTVNGWGSRSLQPQRLSWSHEMWNNSTFQFFHRNSQDFNTLCFSLLPGRTVYEAAKIYLSLLLAIVSAPLDTTLNTG